MNRSFYVHGSWAIIAITCFVLGNHLASSRETTVTGADETELTAREHRLGSSGSSSTSIGSTSRNRLSTGRFAESEPLNAEKIDSLARGFLSSKNPSEKRLVFAELLKGLTPENAESIFEQILDQNSSSLLHRDFHFMWGSKAGAEAVLAAGKAPDSTVAMSAMSDAIAGWASANPQAAIAWFTSSGQVPDSESGELKETLLTGMLEGLTYRDPAAAADFLLTHGDSSEPDTLGRMRDTTHKMVEAAGLESAASWSERLPEGAMRAEAYAQIGEEYFDADSAGALQWLSNLPDSRDKAAGFREVFSSFAAQDPVEAANYIIQMGNSADRDYAVSGYAPNVVDADPVAALGWAQSINDPVLRKNTIIKTAQTYYHDLDQAAAEAWLSNSGLSAEEQARIVAND